MSVRYLYGDRNRPINTRQDCRECGFLAWTLSAESDSCHCEVCDLRGHVRDTATERDAARGRIKELEEKLVEVERQWSFTAEEWCARAEERGRDAGYREGLDAAADRYGYP